VRFDYAPVQIGELLKRDFPVRRSLLAPWLPERSLAMLYGGRGVGKSMLSLSIAIAVAGGRTFLGWEASGQHAVLYVDGEMAREDLQARARRLGGENAAALPLHFMARDLYPEGMPTLDNAELKAAIEEAATEREVKLIILDNLSTLWRGSENEAESWDYMQDWLFRLRRVGRSVLLVHHSGKNGTQRGSSRKEDTLDVVLALRRPSSTGVTTGAAFNVHFEKTRSCLGGGALPFHATLRDADAGLEGWFRSTAKRDDKVAEALALHESGRTLEEIGRHFGVDKSTVSRWLKGAREEQAVAVGGDGDEECSLTETTGERDL